MNPCFRLLFCLFTVLPFSGYCQCSGQFNITYPSGSGTVTQSVNNGTSPINATFCPTAGGTQSLVITQASAGTLTLKRTLNGVTTTLQVVNPSTGNTPYTFPLPAITSQASYELTSTVACSNTKTIVFSIGLAPTLTLAASLTTLCSGSSSVLTATGSSSGSYTWSAPGTASVINTGTLTVAPSASTVYTVTAPTACGTSTQQEVALFVPALTASGATTICPGSSTTLNATSNEAGSTFTWSVGGSTVGTGPSLVVSPSANTTYRVTSSNPSGCATTSFRAVPVSVETQTLAVSPASATIALGGSASLTASTNLSGATYVWHTGGANGPVVGSGPTFAASPTQTTTYTVVSAASTCTPLSRDATVTIGPLPVELVSFGAEWAASAPLLTWVTASEKDCAYFQVERSFDGRYFEAVGRVAGAGTSSHRSEYSFRDVAARSAPGATWYYRLRQTDFSADFFYSAVQAVRCGTRNSSLLASIYPNPCTAATRLYLELPVAGAVVCTLCDVMGRELATMATQMPAAGPQELLLSAVSMLQQGMYFLTVRQGSQVQTLRLQQQ